MQTFIYAVENYQKKARSEVITDSKDLWPVVYATRKQAEAAIERTAQVTGKIKADFRVVVLLLEGEEK